MEAASGHMAQSRASSDNAETSNSFFFSTFRSTNGRVACGVETQCKIAKAWKRAAVKVDSLH